jgi:SAM-dependent methyltransferase
MQNSGQDVILLEPGLQGAIHARNRGIRQVVCSTLEDANFPDRSVPAIGIFDVIEHIENDEAFLRLMHHILAPEGRIYITTPAYQWLWSAEDDFAQHYRRFTISGLKYKLQRAQFRTLFATYIFGVLPVPIFMFRTIPRIFGKRAQRNFEEEQDHQLPGGLVGKWLTQSMEIELRRLRNLKSIPFGGTCLVVAQKED